ncbi:chemotaxis protein CheB [Pannonibacter carbonis]|uniref:chemotaxis protein CheB n=1 Tax=Pannonibacter carbonis TaxID=2067569 RepID=UPI000D0F1211|nr:chemotaxis protein CheB [Pannonibacter carbonis]
MKRPILIAAPGAFERSALHRILAEAFPASPLSQCITAADLQQRLEARFSGLLVLDEALTAAAMPTPALQTGLARLGPRLIALTRDTSVPGPPVGTWARDLPDRVRRAVADQALAVGATTDPAELPASPALASLAAATKHATPACLLVASSTGGPGALARLLQHIPVGALPWIIAQHMPDHGTQAFAAHLADVSGHAVSEIGSQTRLASGGIYVLKGGQDFTLSHTPAGMLTLRPCPAVASPFHPNADHLMQSAAAAGIPAMALVLSGMGEDGARGAAALGQAQNPVYVQEPATCIVPGMPGAALTRFPSALRLDPSAPPPSFVRLCSRRPGED